MKNQYPGRCSKCGKYVPVGAGSWTRAAGTTCTEHEPSLEPVVVMMWAGGVVVVQAEGYLGDKFGAFRTATANAGCRYEAARRNNSCALTSARALIRELERAGIKVDVKPSLAEALQSAPAESEAEEQAPLEAYVAMNLRDGKAFVAPSGYLGDRWDLYRQATIDSGCKFDPTTKGNVCSLEAAGRLIQALRDRGISVSVGDDLMTALQGRVEQVQQETQAAGKRLDAVDAQLAKRGLSLFNYQRAGVEWLSPRIGALLSDGQGCGKTIQTITSLPDGVGVVVVCPSVVKGVWKNEIARWRPEFRTTQLSGRGSFRWPQPNEVVIINYDILPAAPDPKKGNDKGDEVAPCPAGTVVVADEVHYAKNGQAKRTRALKRIANMAQSAGGRAWLLTGTPLVNRPPEMWSVLNCAGLATEVFSSWNNFVRLFNGEKGQWGGYEWGTPEPEVPALLKRVMLRRVKSEVLKDLPEKIYQRVDVDMDDKYAREIERVLKSSGETVDAVVDAIEKAMAEQGKIPFERYSAVREILARAKYGALLEFVEPYEEAGDPILVFSAHLWPVQTLVEEKKRAGKRWALITGADTSADERTRIVEEFQSGKLDGVALTIKAGGVGITLTRASTAIFLDSSWSPADNEQAEDRVHRIGQTRGTTIVQMVADHPIDQRVHELLAEKAMLIAATTEAARTSPGDVVRSAATDIAAGLDVLKGMPAPRRMETPAALPPLPPGQMPERRRRERDEQPFEPTEPPQYRKPQTATEEWAANGLEELILLDPDRARVQNAMGFNQVDGGYARQLSATLNGAGGLTDKQWAALVAMERKYWRQIGRPPDYVEPEKKAKAKRASKKTKEAEPDPPKQNPVKSKRKAARPSCRPSS